GPPGPAGGALQRAAADRRLHAGLLGVAAALAITIPSVLIGVYLRRLYSAGLFLGTPFTIGYISAYVFNARQAQSARHTLEVAVLALALAGGAMLVFALEGALCIALALPLAALLALPGAVLGRAVALRGAGRALLAGALRAPIVVVGSPPHLDGYFRATHGEFRLTPLPGGRTRLEGRTQYVVSLFPQTYWTLPTGRLVAAIHERVLRHIKAIAEEEDHP